MLLSVLRQALVAGHGRIGASTIGEIADGAVDVVVDDIELHDHPVVCAICMDLYRLVEALYCIFLDMAGYDGIEIILVDMDAGIGLRNRGDDGVIIDFYLVLPSTISDGLKAISKQTI